MLIASDVKRSRASCRAESRARLGLRLLKLVKTHAYDTLTATALLRRDDLIGWLVRFACRFDGKSSTSSLIEVSST